MNTYFDGDNFVWDEAHVNPEFYNLRAPHERCPFFEGVVKPYNWRQIWRRRDAQGRNGAYVEEAKRAKKYLPGSLTDGRKSICGEEQAFPIFSSKALNSCLAGIQFSMPLRGVRAVQDLGL